MITAKRYIIALLLALTTLTANAETRLKLSDLSPGTEITNIVANGDFENGDAGWNAVTTNVDAGSAPSNISVPSSTQSALALAYIENDETLGQYRRNVILQGDTEYVLSAYMWELGDDNHHVGVIVVDLNDAGNGTPYGIWEGQLTLYPDAPQADQGYFVYNTFTTPPGEQTVTLRLFYTGLTETDDNWPSFPVAAMWDNIAVTPADEFAQPLPYDPSYNDSLAGDMDDDDDVDFDDLVIFAGNWFCQDCESVADFNDDRRVDYIDYSQLLDNWNKPAQVDTSTLTGKILCGYQGWFDCPGDGSDRGWVHWGKSGRFEPGYCSIDIWPDMTEYDEDEKFATGFEYADGSTAYVFSSHNRKTVLRHFKWMEDYGIDGIFVQRFGVTTYSTRGRNHCDTVLSHCREGANKYDRVYAVMYDLSGLQQGGTQQVIDDWKHLIDDMKISRDPDDKRYLHHNGKPLVAVWGMGFRDRAYTLDECEALLDFLKDDPVYGGFTVMLGIPSYWRTLGGDCVVDSQIYDIIKKADIISPWAVGRFGSIYEGELDNYAGNVWVKDVVWCNNRNIEYMPVVFPGFSWQNLQGYGWDHIPRRGGRFLWRQYYKAIKDAGVTMVYQAMFDEVDEGTAIFKCSNNPPAGSTPFLPTGNAAYPPYDISDADLPSDHYLWLVGEAGRMLRREIEPTITMPVR